MNGIEHPKRFYAFFSAQQHIKIYLNIIKYIYIYIYIYAYVCMYL